MGFLLTVLTHRPVSVRCSPALGNRALVTFKKTEKIPAHSVTVLVSTNLHSVSTVDNKVTVYGTDRLVAKAGNTLVAAKSILKTLEAITGTPSGLDTLSLVGVKDLVVEGTDNWAIDILR